MTEKIEVIDQGEKINWGAQVSSGEETFESKCVSRGDQFTNHASLGRINYWRKDVGGREENRSVRANP